MSWNNQDLFTKKKVKGIKFEKKNYIDLDPEDYLVNLNPKAEEEYINSLPYIDSSNE